MEKIPIIAIIVQRSSQKICKLKTDLKANLECLTVSESTSGALKLSVGTKKLHTVVLHVDVQSNCLWLRNESDAIILVNDIRVQPYDECPLRQLNFILYKGAALLIAWDETLTDTMVEFLTRTAEDFFDHRICRGKKLRVSRTQISTHGFSARRITIGSDLSADCRVIGSLIKDEHATVYFERGQLMVTPINDSPVFMKDSNRLVQIKEPTPINSNPIILGDESNSELTFDLVSKE